MSHLIDFIALKCHPGPALHSATTPIRRFRISFSANLPWRFTACSKPRRSGAIRDDVEAGDLLNAGMRPATPSIDGDTAQARRMVALLVDGLR
ncbi:hypothetical protein CPY51_08305 [Rhizobium tubonense]|uniref:Uncharacterized protein n=1 Tax=Rhizobium tubonense TaxID=484088 RepID=A0A2W4CR89_9HYPH|nr:hypothetical protein CPY51_08305 [Rhizobium tubonense]